MRAAAVLGFMFASLAFSVLAVFPFVSSMSGEQMPNPSAAYCLKLGYRYRIVETPLGEKGICVFPDGSSCDAWAFLGGRCGQEWTLCSRIGGRIIPTNESCAISGSCAVCVLPDGTKKFEWEIFRNSALQFS